jgi:hypothetical protein
MHNQKLSQQMTGMALALLILVGCAAPTVAPIPPPIPNTPLPSPHTFSISPTVGQPSGKPSLFKFIKTVALTPDANFLNGGFPRVGYVPATDRMVVVFGTHLAQPAEGCVDTAHVYMEFTLDMDATGKSGVLNCEGGDSGGLMVDNFYYDVGAQPVQGTDGWRIIKYDAVTWAKLVDISLPLNSPREKNGDPMVAYVNGQIDISSQFNDNPTGAPPADIRAGAATHHQFFSSDLQFLGKKILTDTPHVNCSSMAFVDGVYSFVTASAFGGDLIVMQYDQNWNYLRVKTLIKQAQFSTGLAYDNQRFYVAYLDTSQNSEPNGFLPIYPNVHLAAFDHDWNLMEDVAVTNYTPSDNEQTGRTWVLLHGNRLYVAHDMMPMDPVTHEDQISKIEAYVSVYELTAKP